EALWTAAPDSVPFLLTRLQERREVVLPMLRRSHDAGQPTPARRLRLAVALAVLGEGDAADLVGMTTDTPPGESRNLVLRLKAGDRRAVVTDLSRRYREAEPGVGRTRLAIALLELGETDPARTELAVRANPNDRVRFIYLYATWHGDLEVLPE